jgi:hypothetical protein
MIWGGAGILSEELHQQKDKKQPSQDGANEIQTTQEPERVCPGDSPPDDVLWNSIRGDVDNRIALSQRMV